MPNTSGIIATGIFLFLTVLQGICAAEINERSILDFSIFRLGHSDRCVLVIGGIQGDEPGGFSAASLLATRYEIEKGEIWVVPNLNFPSIIRRSRGLHGDMNRKFAHLDNNDPEFNTVRRIQELILDPRVVLVLNLHDGSGYYRPTFENKLCNPSRWGQSIIIDQDDLGHGIFMSALQEHAEKVKKAVNSTLIDKAHFLNVHNTRTAEGNMEMEKSLSYFAVRNEKAAFGLEASKEFAVEMRTYYHLRMVEEFLEQAGVVFKRDFELTPANIKKALYENMAVSFAENRILLPLENIRPSVNLLPLPRNCENAAILSKPIMAVLRCRDNQNNICVHYGNRLVTLIKPDWREMDRNLDVIPVVVDGMEKKVPLGQIVDVKQKARFHPPENYRINAIGFPSSKNDESNMDLQRKNFITRYSLDRQGQIYRVEIYKKHKFAGIVLIRFKEDKTDFAGGKLMPSISGPESELGY